MSDILNFKTQIIKDLLILIIFSSVISNCEMLKENVIAMSIVNKLNIKHCIILDDDFQTHNMVDVKFFAKNHIFAQFINSEFLLDYLERTNHSNIKTAIIIKAKKIADIFNISFNKVIKIFL